jgi:UDP-N-acetylmuramate--alanine ligase
VNLNNIHNVYFIGIGGIGMSAIARWFNANNYTVVGYDRTATALTTELINEGIQIHFEDSITHISANFTKENTLVVYTPAIPKEHTELNYFRNNGYPLKKRSEVLGLITESKFTIAVAGTHGKTTTSSMVTHLLKECGIDCSAFLGGIAANFNSNLVIGKSDVVVVEADEFDRSFLTLSPDIAVVTSTDADHLDIYGEHSALKQSFNDFLGKIKTNGKYFYKTGLELQSDKKGISYSVNDAKAEISVKNIRIQQASFVFDYISEKAFIQNIQLNMPGYHNVENVLAAISIALELGCETEKIKAGIASFKGVKRRFEYIINSKEVVFIDDYAHHPTEIEAFLNSVKALYPERKLLVVFQPHLYSRTRDFADGFAQSLSIADEVLLLDIYPARELPIKGVSSEIIFDKITSQKQLITKSEVANELEKRDINLIATIGAGDIDTLVLPIKNQLGRRFANA